MGLEPEEVGSSALGDEQAETVRRRFAQRYLGRLAQLVDEAMIREFASFPRGQHSDALARVVRYFRLLPPEGKLVVVYAASAQRWRLGVVRSAPALHVEVEPGEFASERAAEVAVFLRRLVDVLGLSPEWVQQAAEGTRSLGDE